MFAARSIVGPMTTGRNPYDDLGSRYEAFKAFTLPVSGSVMLFGPELEVIGTRAFQRLAGIKQLGTSYVVYRGALHTRFDHSLGALHQAEKMLTAIESNPRDPYEVVPRARRIARLGALLHDLTHVPFGHTLEDEFGLLRRHDENDFRRRKLLVESEIGQILRDALGSSDFDLLQSTLNAKSDEEFSDLEFPFVGDIVGNTVCADLLDYVQRDCLYCGLPAAIGEWVLDYLSVTREDEGMRIDQHRLVLNLDKRGIPRPDVESEVVKLLTLRYELAERVYFHHAKNAASVMIGRAVQEAGFAVGGDSPLNLDANFHYLTDDTLLLALADPVIATSLGVTSDASLGGDRALSQELGRMVMDRDLYKIAYLAVWEDLPNSVRRLSSSYSDPSTRAQLEDQLADDSGIPHGGVLVHILRARMMSKVADVRVRTDEGEILKLQDWDKTHTRRIDALNSAHERLWRVLVYVHPKYQDQKHVLAAAAEREFKARSRYVRLPSASAYERVLFDELGKEWELLAGDFEAVGTAALTEAEGREGAEGRILASIQERRGRLGLQELRRLKPR